MLRSGQDLKYPAAIALDNVDKLSEPSALYKNFNLSIEINYCKFVFAKSNGSDSLVTYIPVVGQCLAFNIGINGLFL